MKQGMTLAELAKQVRDENAIKNDYVCPTEHLSVSSDANSTTLRIGQQEQFFTCSEHFHNQMASVLNIPRPYYSRMQKENPELLDLNINSWFVKEPKIRMVRTLGNKARALLSNKYRRLDNIDLLERAIPIFQEMGDDVRFDSQYLSEDKLTIKALFPKIQAEVEKGDIVQSGVCLSNSEIGLGMLKIEPLVFRLICKNGAVINDFASRAKHVGKGLEGDDEFRFLQDDTLEATDNALWLRVRDTLRATTQEVQFQTIVNNFRESLNVGLPPDAQRVVETLSNKKSLHDSERASVLDYLISGGTLTQYGLGNAITAAAQTVASYDRSTDLERIGGSVLMMPANEFRELVAA